MLFQALQIQGLENIGDIDLNQPPLELVTISVGLAALSPDQKNSFDELRKEADNAL